jgi:hypothetical protein
MGALPDEVPETVMVSSGCFFSLALNCPGERATVNGSEVSFLLLLAGRDTLDARPVQQTRTLIEITGVTFETRE